MRHPLLLAAVAALALPLQDEPEKPALPEIGGPAPTFRVNDHTGRAVAIGGESERWSVVAFFPKAATPG